MASDMEMTGNKPTFVGIGAQKCASTWLYHVLQDHPEVQVSEEKELNFFSFNFDRGYQWYEHHFADAAKSVCGEISPSYFCEEGVPQRVREYRKDMKVIVSFRDPVERALSNHRHEVRLGNFHSPDNSFESGLTNNPMYVQQGRYATHLKRWLAYFPEEQIFSVLMEDIKADPLAVAQRLYEFVGVDATFEPQSIDRKYNVSFANRSQGLRRIKDVAYKMSSTPGLRWTWSLGKKLGLRSAYRKVNTMESSEAIQEPPADLLHGLREKFAPELRGLAELIRRPLDSWL